MGDSLTLADFAAACEHAPDATLLIDSAGTIVAANQRAAGMFGHAAADLVGESIETLVPTELRDAHRAHRARFARHPEARPMGARLQLTALRADGRAFPVEISLSPLDVEGAPYVAASARDVTERVVAEANVRRSEERFRLLAEHARDVVYRVRLDDVDAPIRFEYMAPAATRVLGHPPEEYYSDPLLAQSTIHPDDRAAHEAWLHREHEEEPSPPLRVERPDGSQTWIEFVETWIRDGAGNLVAIEGSARDVSERVAAAEVLRRSEEQFRLLAERSQDIIFLVRVDRDGWPIRVQYMSPAVTKLLGHTPEEFYADPLLLRSLRQPDDLPAFDAWRHREREEQPSPPSRHRGADGSVVWLEYAETWIRDASGNLIAVEGFARDVSERVAAEEALRRSEEQFRLLAESSREVIFRVQVDGVGWPVSVEYMNSAVKGVLGYEPAEFYADALLLRRIKHPDDLIIFEEWLHREREEQPSPPIRHRRRDGSWVWLEFMETRVRDNAGNVLATERFTRDVSERVAAEEALRRSEEQFRLLAEQAVDMIYLGRVAPDGRRAFEYVSPASLRIFGYRSEEFRANPDLVDELLHPDDRAARDAWLRDGGQVGLSPVLRYRRKDGSWTWIETQVSRLEDGEDGAARYEGLLRDVSERVAAEAARHWVEIESELEAERVRIAHDLHDGILGGLFGVGLELKAMAQQLEPASTELAARTNTTAEDVGAISRDIRAYVMGLRAGQFTGDLAVSVGELCDHFESASGTPTRLVAETLPDGLAEDAAVAAFRVVQEALNNVRKHAQATAVEVQLACDGETLSVRVRDNGRGFDAARRPLSTSIGMRSMAHRAQSLGGVLRVESTPQQGTTVEADIPLG
ncbi:MAG: PAS domain S-box protein [Dehalococcoidia bacterium]